MFLANKLNKGSGSAAPDDKFNYVTMLLHGDGTNGAQNNTFVDSSTNNFTITRNGNTTQGSFSPYGSNWSNNFVRASTQYLTVSNAGGQFSFGTGAFTIECWVNLASMPSGTGYPASYWLFGGGPVNSDAGIDFYINNTQIGFNLTAFTSSTAIGNHGMSVGNWYHVAVVRGGGSNQTVSIYVNGTRVATASSVTATADVATTGIAISAAEPSGATSGNFDGYISNYRVVKGTAAYDPTSSTLTVPTAPLTAIANTQLLTCQSNRFIDNSTNAFAITVNGTPSVQRFNPFGTSTAYSTSVIGGSAYFDGTGDYLGVSSAAIAATGQFCIEAWVYQTGRSVSTSQGIYSQYTGGVSGRFYFRFNSDKLSFTSSAGDNIGASTLITNTWYHVAVTRDASNVLRLFVNGVLDYNATVTQSLQVTTPQIGAIAGGECWQGYLTDVRTTSGSIPTAYQTSSTTNGTSIFTPNTSPLTAITNTSLLTNMTNGAIFDNAMMNDLETVGNAQISTSVKKYGTGSIAFDGTGDWLACTAIPNLILGVGDFTIECWVYINSYTSYGIFCGQWNASETQAWAFRQNSTTGKLMLTANSHIGEISVTSSGTIGTGAWAHIAVTRSGSTFRLFINGTQDGSTTSSGIITSTSNYFSVGGTGGINPDAMNGYIDDLRITKGYARYTSNFTAPTAAFSDKGPI